jgi:hypothetical protein
MVSRPPENQPIHKLMLREIAALREEYGLAASKVHYNRVSSLDGSIFPVQRFELTGLWQDEAALEEARETFARLFW